MELHEGLIFVNLGSNCSLTLNFSLKNNKLRRITWGLWAHRPHSSQTPWAHLQGWFTDIQQLNSTSSLGNGAAVGPSSVCSCFLRDEQLEGLVPTVGRWSKINWFFWECSTVRAGSGGTGHADFWVLWAMLGAHQLLAQCSMETNLCSEGNRWESSSFHHSKHFESRPWEIIHFYSWRRHIGLYGK